MFDIQSDLFDQKRLSEALASLSDDELDALEDDLDFCNFTGVPTPRVLEVLKGLTELDAGWERMLRKKSQPIVPQPY